MEKGERLKRKRLVKVEKGVEKEVEKEVVGGGYLMFEESFSLVASSRALIGAEVLACYIPTPAS